MFNSQSNGTCKETRNRVAQFSRNGIMEKIKRYVFQTSVRFFFFFFFFFCLRGIHFDMASEKTKSARHWSRAREIIKCVYNVCRKERKMGSCPYVKL